MSSVLLKDLVPGGKYVVQVRGKDINNATSPWSIAYTFITQSDVTPPAPITGLNWVVNETTFNATWTAPTTNADGTELKDFKDYQVVISSGATSALYYVSQPSFDFTLEMNKAVFGSAQVSLSISVKARDTINNLSTAVTASATHPVPADVINFVATGMNNSISLQWDKNSEADIDGYEIWVGSTSGFTPSGSNKIFTGPANSFVYPTNIFTLQYFKIKAINLFAQESANYVSTSATAIDSSGLDTSPPDAPTGVTATTALLSDGSASISVSWTAVTSTNLADYAVRWSTDEINWQYTTIDRGETQTIITDLLPNTAYYVSVASKSFVASYSAFVHASTYPLTTAQDTVAPSTPAAPSVSVNTQSVQVSHNMKKADGVTNLESKVDYLEVHAGTTSTFTTSDSTRVGTINAAGPGITVSAIFSYAVASTSTIYWKVIAVGNNNLKSSASTSTTGTPNLIQNANIADATITNAKINDLSASKITAGTINTGDINVGSNLVVSSAGHMKSSNYDATAKTGWTLDNNGLVIYDGTVAGKALQLQDGVNLVPTGYADFEFNTTYYHDSSNVPNPSYLTAQDTTNTKVQIVGTGQKFGTQCLRIYNTALTNGSHTYLVLAPTGLTVDTNMNISLAPGDYIVSAYVKRNTANSNSMKFTAYTDAGTSIAQTAAAVAINQTTMTRVYATITIPSGISTAKLYLDIYSNTSGAGFDFAIDGVQVERVIGGLTTPSAWKPSSTTSIDGGAIVTGSIRSNQPSATIPTQPAWSINTQGNMQIGDAVIRGSLLTGTATQTTNTANLLNAKFQSFENTSTQYVNGSGVSATFTDSNGNASQNVITRDANAIAASALIYISTDAYIGAQSLRVQAANSGANTLSFILKNTAPNDIAVTPGQNYIFSAYVKSSVGFTTKQTATLQLWNTSNTGVVTKIGGGTPQNVTSSWSRIFWIWTCPTGTTAVTAAISAYGDTSYPNAVDCLFDALQFELAATGQREPSDYIQYTYENSYVRSANYVAGKSGWSIAGDGSVEFNSGTFRGQLNIQRSDTDNVYSLTSNNPYSRFSYATDLNTPSGQYFIDSVNPMLRFKGYAQSNVTGTDGIQYFDPTQPAQAALRMKPDGNIQLLYVNNQDDDLINTDGNYLFNSAGGRKNDSYSFTESTWGAYRGGPSSFSTPLTSASATNSWSFMYDSATSTPKYQNQSYVTTKSAAEKGYLYNTLGTTSIGNSGYYRFISGNQVLDNYDDFNSQTGSWYATNTGVSGLTISSTLNTTIIAAGGKTYNGLALTSTATTGRIYIGTSATNYNISGIVKSAKFLAACWVSPLGSARTVRAVLKTSDGQEFYGSTYTLPYDGIVTHAYGYSSNIEISNTVAVGATAVLAFEFGFGASGRSVVITAITFAPAFSDNDGARFSPKGATDSIVAFSEFSTATNMYPKDYGWVSASNGSNSWDPKGNEDSNLFTLAHSEWNDKYGQFYSYMSTFRDRLEFVTLEKLTGFSSTYGIAQLTKNSFDVAFNGVLGHHVTPNGVYSGNATAQDPQWPNAIGWSMSNTAVTGNATSPAGGYVGTGSPTYISMLRLDGSSTLAVYQDGGAVYPSSTQNVTCLIGGTKTVSTWLFVCSRAGLYMMSALGQTGTATGVIEAHKYAYNVTAFSTTAGQMVSLSSQQAGWHSLSALTWCNVGDKLYFDLFNSSTSSTITFTNLEFRVAQII